MITDCIDDDLVKGLTSPVDVNCTPIREHHKGLGVGLLDKL